MGPAAKAHHQLVWGHSLLKQPNNNNNNNNINNNSNNQNDIIEME